MVRLAICHSSSLATVELLNDLGASALENHKIASLTSVFCSILRARELFDLDNRLAFGKIAAQTDQEGQGFLIQTKNIASVAMLPASEIREKAAPAKAAAAERDICGNS